MYASWLCAQMPLCPALEQRLKMCFIQNGKSAPTRRVAVFSPDFVSHRLGCWLASLPCACLILGHWLSHFKSVLQPRRCNFMLKYEPWKWIAWLLCYRQRCIMKSIASWLGDACAAQVLSRTKTIAWNTFEVSAIKHCVHGSTALMKMTCNKTWNWQIYNIAFTSANFVKWTGKFWWSWMNREI